MTPSSAQHRWVKAEDWETHREKIHQLYCMSDKPLKQVMKIMENDHDFHATINMYKARFKSWGFRKNISARDSLIIQRQTYTRNGQLPVIHGHQLGSKRLKALVDRASTQVPQITRSPDCMYFTESALNAVLNYSKGGFDNNRWDFETLDYFYHTRKWGGNLRQAAIQIGQGREIVLNFQALDKCCAEFPAVSRKQDPLLIMGTYLSALHLAYYADKKLAELFIRYVAGITEIQFEGNHPLVQLWKSIQNMGIVQASQVVETVFRAQFEIFHQRLGLKNPLLNKATYKIVHCLIRMRLISVELCQHFLHSYSGAQGQPSV